MSLSAWDERMFCCYMQKGKKRKIGASSGGTQRVIYSKVKAWRHEHQLFSLSSRVHLLLGSVLNIGPVISRWELEKFKNSWNKSFRTSMILTLLYQQLSNLLISQRDMSGPKLGALSNNRWSGVPARLQRATAIAPIARGRHHELANMIEQIYEKPCQFRQDPKEWISGG